MADRTDHATLAADSLLGVFLADRAAMFKASRAYRMKLKAERPVLPPVALAARWFDAETEQYRAVCHAS